MNHIADNKPVEQLWYTWSDVGLSTIHAGFRIRAASPGLTEIYSERVKNVERNTRYVLPPNTDRSITPDMAPVGLAFLRSEWNNEYLLIHKKYTGVDGVGRQGNFFAHALALGENRGFSVEDAIWLWEAALWKTTDSELDRRSTSLPTLSSNDLHNTNTHFRREHFRLVQDALQFVIAAYLMRKDKNVPIYIGAPADQTFRIATLIAGLAYCLPAQLISDLTFSTYEPDITRATTGIVGTSWITAPGKGQDATSVLPRGTYQERLAINCETREQANLQSHPQAIYNQQAADFAAYAAECLATGISEQLYALRDYAETSRNLDIPLFLHLYYNQIVNTVSMDEAGIEKYLNSDLCANWLAQRNSRKKIIDRAIANPLWARGRLNDTLLALRGQAEREAETAAQSARRIGTSSISVDSEQMASVAPSEIQTRWQRRKGSAQTKKPPATLADSLALLAKSIVPEVVKQMGQAQAMPEDRPNERRQRVDTTTILLRLIDDCLLPQDPTEVWRQLFEKIEDSKAARAFLTTEWTIHAWLLKVWSRFLPANWQEDDRMRPLLTIPWSRLGEFLSFGLQERHPNWIIFPVQELVAHPQALTPQIAKELELNYAREIGLLLATLMQTRHLADETYFIIRLVEKGHSVNATLETPVEQLLEIFSREGQFQRTAKELITTLLAASYTGSQLYQRYVEAVTRSLLASQFQDGHALIEALIASDVPHGWLVDLLIERNGSPVDLLSVIQYVYPTPEGQNKFFLQDGARYSGREEYRSDMVKLYQQLLPLSGKLQRLFILLDATTDQGTIFSLLKLTPLDGREWEAILQRYGQRYLQSSQQAPGLTSMVVKNFSNLVKMGHSNNLLFNILPQQIGNSYLEELLTAAQLTPVQQVAFLEGYGPYYVTHYPQMPILMSYISSYITNFRLNFLERDAAKNFFTLLMHSYKSLALDAGSANKIASWKVILDYFNAPGMEPQKLQSLTGALLLLNLPDSPYFTERLARAFSFCIRTATDISHLTNYMKEVPTLKNDLSEKNRFLYALATEAAGQALDVGSAQPRLGTLIPYLVFALNLPPQERSTRFFMLFLDKLFYYIAVSNIPLWVSLNDIVEAQGLSSAAIERWHTYLFKLEIWEKINAQSSRGRSRSARANGGETGSWSQRLLSRIPLRGKAQDSEAATGQHAGSEAARQISLPVSNGNNTAIPKRSSAGGTVPGAPEKGSPGNPSSGGLTYPSRQRSDRGRK